MTHHTPPRDDLPPRSRLIAQLREINEYIFIAKRKLALLRPLRTMLLADLRAIRPSQPGDQP